MPFTRWDMSLKEAHPRPDFQPFEYFASGQYLGEICRLALLEAIETAGVFGGVVPAPLNEPYSLDSETLSVFREYVVIHAVCVIPIHHSPVLYRIYFVLFFYAYFLTVFIGMNRVSSKMPATTLSRYILAIPQSTTLSSSKSWRTWSHYDPPPSSQPPSSHFGSYNASVRTSWYKYTATKPQLTAQRVL